MTDRLGKISFKWMLVSLVVLATGCITIEENYTFKKNGSGTMEYVVDASLFRDLMNAFPDEDGKKKSKNEGPPMESKLTDRVKALKQLPGLKKVKFKEEKDGFVERVSFAFADIAALNRALNVLMPDSLRPEQEFFRWEGNTLVRQGNSYANLMANDMSSGRDSTLALGNDLLANMKYKLSFKFADPVGDVALAEGIAQEKPKPNMVAVATDWSLIGRDPKALDMRITLAE